MLVVVAAPVLGFAPAPPARPTGGEADLREMQGMWVLASREEPHQVVPLPLPDRKHWIVVEGDRLKYLSGGKVYDEYVLSLDPRRSPKWYDARSVRERDWVYHGIYSLRAGALKLCENGLRGRRPEAFAGPRAGNVVYLYTREKPGAPAGPGR
jgi:uncharacterized protein (TIGR03067 family)